MYTNFEKYDIILIILQKLKGLITIPELPEVENVKRSLENKVIGKTIVGCSVINEKLIKKPTVQEFAKDITGLKITYLYRRGKYLVFTMDFSYELVVHLGMTGLLIHVNNINEIPQKYSKHLHVLIQLDGNTLLCYCDIRKFGSLRLLRQINPYEAIAKMGPEPWEIGVRKSFKTRLSAKKWTNKTIKEAIMNQEVIAGVGNIYASEALYASRIDPNRLVNKITDVERELILTNIQDILQKSIDLGGTSISDYLNGEGKKGQFQNYLKIYGKKKCECGADLKIVEIKGRNTFYCQNCQK